MSWRIDDVSFDLVGDLTEGPVMTIRVSTPDGSLVMMAEPEENGRTLRLRRFNAEGMAANALGPAKLRAMADVLMEKMDCDKDKEIPVWEEYKKIVARHDARGAAAFGSYERFEFYDEARKTYCILQSGETAIYANIILQKGVIK